jgi:hypothetical protein
MRKPLRSEAESFIEAWFVDEYNLDFSVRLSWNTPSSEKEADLKLLT